MNPLGAKEILRPDFTSKLVHVLTFGTPKFYIAPYDKIKHELVNLSSNCDVKSGLKDSSEGMLKVHQMNKLPLIRYVNLLLESVARLCR